MEKLAAEMAAAEEAARRRAEEREREAAEQVERAAQEEPQPAAGVQANANPEQTSASEAKDGEDKPTPMETGQTGTIMFSNFEYSTKIE